MFKRLIRTVLVLGISLITAGTAGAATEQFMADVQKLTEAPHRLGGTEEYGKAAQYVQERLNTMGLDQVFIQEFPTAQTRQDRCELITNDGRSLPLSPGRPNSIMPSVTGPEGISGELIYIGKGSEDDFDNADPNGKIAVMDFNCGDNFLQAFRLGAKAIIFVRTEPMLAWNYHYVRSNANLPRFYYEGSRSDLPNGMKVTLYSDVNWARVTGRNIIGYLKGTSPTFNFDDEEVIILAARLDTFGEFPRVTPGTRGAANCAGLLKIAEKFAENPPKRNVIFLFLDAEARFHAGAAAFYSAFEKEDKKTTIKARLEYWKQEKEFLDQMSTLINSEAPLSSVSTDYGRDLARRLRNKAKDATSVIRGKLLDNRELADELRKTTGDHAEKLAELEKNEDDLIIQKNRWSDLRRSLGRNEVDPTVTDLFDQIMDSVKEDIRIRQIELQQDKQMFETSQMIADLLEDQRISLHVSLLLGDNTDRWGVIIGGDSEIHSPRDQAGLYGKIQNCFLQSFRAMKEAGIAPPRFETSSVSDALTESRLLWATPMLVHSGEIAGRFGFYNIVLGTIQERLAREGTPDDTKEFINVDLIEQNIDEVIQLLGGNQSNGSSYDNAVLNLDNMSLRNSMESDKQFITSYFDDGRPQGAQCMGRIRGSAVPNTPVPGAAVQLYTWPPWNRCFWPYSKAYGFDHFYVVMSDQNGTYNAGPLPKGENGTRGFAVAFDEFGQPVMASDNESNGKALNRLNMFTSANGFLMLPPGFWQDPAKIMKARANALISDDGNDKAYTETTDGVIIFFCENKIPAIKAFNLRCVAALDYQPTGKLKAKDETYGTGFAFADTKWTSILTSKQSAQDLWNLNESRLNIMRSRDIMNSSLEELHGRVQDTIKEAEETDSPAKSEALNAGAFLSSMPVYSLVRTNMDDLITAVLILLALCVPFAFALERLLIGASMIYKQVLWFAIFFVITFIILYLSHPAFAIAQTPVIIFLGFTVVVLAVFVIFIIMQKFEVELKCMQGMTATVHSSDISRFNTIMAAMSMGISTMRRRPLRTALTAITIMLLTFTILCFASFDTQKGVIKLFTAPSPPYTGVMMRNATYGSYNPDYLNIIEGRWNKTANVCPRYWVCPEFERDPDFVVSHEDGKNPIMLRGILGLAPNELKVRADLRKLLHMENPNDIEDKVFITKAVATLLNVKEGDTVLIKGLHLKVGPLLASSELSIARDMDGSSILPVDFLAMKDAQADKKSGGDVTDEQSKWSSLPVDSIVIMSSANCLKSYGKCHAIPIYTEDSQQSGEIAEEIARMIDKTPVIATRKDGVYRHILGTTVAASGVSDLLFPVLLGGLVIFGTMLGSVADREKEIYTFSALGLAPPHVASLFFAEAMVYSVIGGLGGYLIAQGSMKILGVLASYGLVQVPEMNYSSTNAIVTILIVMATVMVSAIYPAIKASKSANPGLLRSWKLPAPEGDVLDLVFPFTVSEYDLTGVVSFLKEHFDTFSDTGLGSFMASDAGLVIEDDDTLGVTAVLAIAPFDLGVTEKILLKSAPSEIAGIDEVNICLTRVSGQPKDWIRLNKVLLDDLRTQFLLWRSLPAETMEHYRQQTLALIKEHKTGANKV